MYVYLHITHYVSCMSVFHCFTILVPVLCCVDVVSRNTGWPSGLVTWLLLLATGRCAGRDRIPLRTTSLRNSSNSVYPALPVSFGGDNQSRRSLLSGVYARGSKISHQSALECVTVVDSTTHSIKFPTRFFQSSFCGWKRCPELVSEEEEEINKHSFIYSFIVFSTSVDSVVLLSRNINHNLVNWIFSYFDPRSAIVVSYNADVV